MSDLETAPDSNPDPDGDGSEFNGEETADAPEEEVSEETEASEEEAKPLPEAYVLPPVNQAYDEELRDSLAEREEAMQTEPEAVDVDFSIASHLDPRRQVDPHGIYLDDIERQNAEIRRARAEGREPDLENPPPYAGDQIVQTQVAKESGQFATTSYPVAFTAPVVMGKPADEEVPEDQRSVSYDEAKTPSDDDEE